jgi:hypothetical protein
MSWSAVTAGGFVAAEEISQQLTSYALVHTELLWPYPALT